MARTDRNIKKIYNEIYCKYLNVISNFLCLGKKNNTVIEYINIPSKKSYVEKANKIYYDSLKKILNFIYLEFKTDTDKVIFYNELNSNLYHYCELMLRGHICNVDFLQNYKPDTLLVANNICDLTKAKSIDASRLIRLIKRMYGTDFLKSQSIKFNNFAIVFNKLTNNRNPYMHGDIMNFTNEIDRTISFELLNLYIECFYVLDKRDFFLSFKEHLSEPINKKNSELAKTGNVLVTLFAEFSSFSQKQNTSNITFMKPHLHYFTTLFESTKYFKEVYSIANCDITLNCMTCFETSNYDYDLKHKTLVKTIGGSGFCYICKEKSEIFEKNCIKCIKKGYHKSYSVDDLCIQCFVDEDLSNRTGISAMLKKEKEKNDKRKVHYHSLLKNIDINIFNVDFHRYPIFPKNDKTIFNKKTLNFLSKEPLSCVDNIYYATMINGTGKKFKEARLIVKNKQYVKRLNDYLISFSERYSTEQCYLNYKSQYCVDDVMLLDKEMIFEYNIILFNNDFKVLLNLIKNNQEKDYFQKKIFKTIVNQIRLNIEKFKK